MVTYVFMKTKKKTTLQSDITYINKTYIIVVRALLNVFLVVFYYCLHFLSAILLPHG